MNARTKKWLYGLGSAVIGGGSGAVVAGFTNIAIAPGTFNLTTLDGALKVMISMLVNFLIVGFFSLFFYLKQAPLPELGTGDTETFKKP